jgi:hypothetical protein
MLNVLQNIISNHDPEVNPNPYLRQPKEKNSIGTLKIQTSKMDEHISPWVYYNLYGDKVLWPKIIVFILISVVVSVGVVFTVAYVLDTFNII